HGQRALMEIDAQNLLGRMIDDAERAHELRQSEIAKAGFRLRAGDKLVDDDGIVVGQKPDELDDLGDRLLRLMPAEQNVGDDDGPRIDEWIARPAMLVFKLDDGVEG